MKKFKYKIYTVAVLILFFFNNTIASDAAFEFKNSDFYKESGLFKDAIITGSDVLILDATEKFIAFSDRDKENKIKEAAKLFRKIINSEYTSVLIGIKEDISKTIIYKIKKDGSLEKVDQFGSASVNETKSIYTSMGLSGNMNGLSQVGIVAGTYLFNNFLDIAGNLSASTANLLLGASTRIHFLINPKWDLNLGAQISLNMTEENSDTTLAALFGVSNFISYRSSLDFSLIMATSGLITLGSGVTYYFNMLPDLGIEKPSPVIKKVEIIPTDTPTKIQIVKETDTPTPIHTKILVVVPTFTPTYSPTVFIAPTATSTPTEQIKETKSDYKDIEELKAQLKQEILQELKQGKTEEKEITKKDTTAGFFFETNLYNYGVMFFKFNLDESTEDYIDANFRLGWGNDSVFGNSFIGEINYCKFILGDFAYTWGLDIAFEFYPFQRSPSGLYIAPVIGGLFYHGEKLGVLIDTPVFCLGGAGGFRFLFDWFILDLGATYKANLVIKDEEYEITDPFVHTVYTKDLTYIPDDELIFNISIGIMFYAR